MPWCCATYRAARLLASTGMPAVWLRRGEGIDRGGDVIEPLLQSVIAVFAGRITRCKVTRCATFNELVLP